MKELITDIYSYLLQECKLYKHLDKNWSFCSALYRLGYTWDEVPELVKMEPKEILSGGNWFGPKDYDARIKILETIINQSKNEKD